MKSSDSKENGVLPGDYDLIAQVFKISPETVRKVWKQYRRDNHNIHKAFQILNQHRSKTHAELVAKLKALRKTRAAA